MTCARAHAGSADPDGGVDAAAPPAHPAAHVRVPHGAARRGRARLQGRRLAAGRAGRRWARPQHPERPQFRITKYDRNCVRVCVFEGEMR